IVEAVARACALSADQCPVAVERDQDPPQVGLITNVLNAVLADWCSRHRLAPNLVASSNDVRVLVRARLASGASHGPGHRGHDWPRSPLPEESLLTRGWRARHVLPELLAVLDGRRGLRIADVTSEAPFTFTDVALPSAATSEEAAAEG